VSLGNSRGYRPTIPLPNYDVKLLKPQNILGMLAAGTRDLGFAGADWIAELGIEGLVEVLDTGMDPVRIVAAAPNPRILLEAKGGLGGRKLIVASEYGGLTAKWLAARGIDAHFLRAYGATESLPPEDADIIVDNAATGSTLKANGLEIIDSLMNSTTRLYASAAAWADPAKRARIEKLVLLLRSVLEARKRLMVTFNVPAADLGTMLETLPWCGSSSRARPRRVCVSPPPPPLPNASAACARPPCPPCTTARGTR
jgi:ATP phosphoribosyltransferase